VRDTVQNRQCDTSELKFLCFKTIEAFVSQSGDFGSSVVSKMMLSSGNFAAWRPKAAACAKEFVRDGAAACGTPPSAADSTEYLRERG
jgi:hypothetical protein